MDRVRMWDEKESKRRKSMWVNEQDQPDGATPGVHRRFRESATRLLFSQGAFLRVW